jgi:riboflavin kinase/FMN adenylyltransferase
LHISSIPSEAERLEQKTGEDLMSVFELAWDAELPPACRSGALTIGNFDGVHRGHQALIAALRGQAIVVRGPAIALTFDPHPMEILRPGISPPPLLTVRERGEMLARVGADHVVVLQINAEFLHLSAQLFFDRIIDQGFQAQGLVEGFNFAFGRDRLGTIDTLRNLCTTKGKELVVLPPLVIDGSPVSSSRIRVALDMGNVREAAALLGRPYQVTGQVARGQERGQTLGFPTANLVQVRTLVPADGVYAVRTAALGRVWAGAANIGPNPTFGEQARKVEVHLIGFDGDLYGETLSVEFIERLRDTVRFTNVASLIEQLRRDVETARNLAGWN